jgi:hypothetical protein
VPVVREGGYSGGARALFVALAGVALVVALLLHESSALRLLRAPAVVVLGALALLGVVSAAWTIGAPSDALLWGLVVCAYAAVVVVAGLVRVSFLAVGLAAVAFVCAVWGLAAVALLEEPWAERINRVWQPGGPFEYPPALATLQVAALPVLLTGMLAARRSVGLAAAFAGAVAAETIALTTSRFALAAAAAIALLALLSPQRRSAAAALALLVSAGVGAELTAGGQLAPSAQPDETVRLFALAGIAAGATLVWWALRSATSSSPPDVATARHRLVAAAVVGGLALAAVLSASSGGGFTHGRTALWGEAVETWLDRPLLGAGADTFLLASRPHQEGDLVRYAHALPLELAVELGVLGLILALALYAASGHVLWRVRHTPAAWLLGPGVAVFLVFNLVDWTWHLAGMGALWAAALGGCLGVRVAAPGQGRAAR